MNILEWVITGVAAYGLFVVVLARWLRAAGLRQTQSLPPFRPIPAASVPSQPARGVIRIVA